MAQKENNHYVPRLILRKFDEKISTYNLINGELKLNQNLDNVFASKKLYSAEIEDLFNYKVENEFAQLLNKTIIPSKETCIFTRKEVNLIKKFLLLAMLRTIHTGNYAQEKSSKLRETVRINYKFTEKAEITTLSPFDYWMQTLKCILDVNSQHDIIKNELSTVFAVYWANVFMSGYLAIWDSTEFKEEFVIMDQGMTSEHEKTRFIPQFDNDLIKRGYLLNKVFEFGQNISTNDSNLAFKYIQLSMSNDGFSENMYLFTVSKNRMLVLINPFFRLYDIDDWKGYDKIEIPDIWTTSLMDKSLFEKNKNEYKGSSTIYTGSSNDDDKFIYKIKSMKFKT